MREGVMSIEDRIWVVQCLRDAVEEIRENGFGCFSRAPRFASTTAD